MQVKGRFTTKIQATGKETEQEIYVVKDLHKPLLGRPAIEALELVARVNAIQEKRPEQLFPEAWGN